MEKIFDMETLRIIEFHLPADAAGTLVKNDRIV